MLHLILSILSSTLILVIFKIAGKKNLPAIFLVILNYFSASAIGFALTGSALTNILVSYRNIWLPVSIVGAIYVFTFFLIGETTKKAGIAITTIAAKMSFIIPISLSLWIDANDVLSVDKLLLLTAAFVAVFLSVYNKSENNSKEWLYPTLLFIFLGLADSVVKYMQTFHIQSDKTSAEFSSMVFSVSALCSIVVWIFYGKERLQIFKIKTVLLGLLVGILNFSSLYFFINALNAVKINNSIVISINNIGIVLLSLTIGLFWFKEKLNRINKIGIALSILLIIVLSFSI
ncbi:MAG TPA: hypothetical protein PK990_03695 [Salinivirgaceae bacterium]|nr:hypothetical protein [Salinivirgaceae bacterium]